MDAGIVTRFPLDGNNVESITILEARIETLNKELGGLDQLSLFGWSHRLKCCSVTCTSAATHLYKNDGVIDLHDEIDLTAFAAEVALQQAQSLRLKILAGHLFRLIADILLSRP